MPVCSLTAAAKRAFRSTAGSPGRAVTQSGKDRQYTIWSGDRGPPMAMAHPPSPATSSRTGAESSKVTTFRGSPVRPSRPRKAGPMTLTRARTSVSSRAPG